jgi:hypothetical protein
MAYLWAVLAVIAAAVLMRAAHQLGKEDGEESGFENGYKFARIRALQYTGYENGQAS